MKDVIIPSGYEQAFNYYLGDASGVSESEARNNLMHQLNADNLSG